MLSHVFQHPNGGPITRTSAQGWLWSTFCHTQGTHTAAKLVPVPIRHTATPVHNVPGCEREQTARPGASRRLRHDLR